MRVGTWTRDGRRPIGPRPTVDGEDAGRRTGRSPLLPSKRENAVIERMKKTRRRIIACLAVSADGYIARPDGDVEWLNRRPQKSDYGMRAFYAKIDTILLGRKTYDWAMNYYRKIGKTKGLFDTKVANYVFSRRPARRAPPGVEFVRGPVKAFARRLRARRGKNVWMMGGGGLIASFLDAGEIDEIRLFLAPIVLGGRTARDPLEGEGVDVIADAVRALTLDCEQVADDLLVSARMKEW